MAEKLCGMTGSFATTGTYPPQHPGEMQANGTIRAVQYQGAATRLN